MTPGAFGLNRTRTLRKVAGRVTIKYSAPSHREQLITPTGDGDVRTECKHRSRYEAFGRGDVPGVLGALDSKVEWLEAENFIYAEGNPYVGPTAVLEGVFTPLASEWEGFGVSPIEILDAGATVVGRGYYNGTYMQRGQVPF
ncbi:MAG: hypothetical protein WAV20_06235 [Blastocatellia bacterium]